MAGLALVRAAGSEKLDPVKLYLTSAWADQAPLVAATIATIKVIKMEMARIG